ncbi:MAG: hypothetical protein ACYTEK_19295 [Planctomycetota bacterium]
MSKASGPGKNGDNAPEQTFDQMAPQPAGEGPDRAAAEGAIDETTGIPKFDLAEQIMAEQRKTAATRRKGPGRKTRPEKCEIPEPVARVVELAAPQSEREEILVEIVARDIRQLCGGHASGLR